MIGFMESLDDVVTTPSGQLGAMPLT